MFRVRFICQWFCIQLSLVLLFASIDSQDEKECAPNDVNELRWPTTQKFHYATSDPVCINENMTIARRFCNMNASWESPPPCKYIQKSIVNPCPPNFVSKSNICLFIIKNTKYPPDCPYEENLPFQKYVDEVDLDVFPIWMPLVRDTGQYGVGDFYWTELSSSYKSLYTSCNNDSCRYFYTGTIENKNCLIYYNATYVEAVACSDTHNAVCAYESLPNKTKSFCSLIYSKTCMQSDYSTKSKCFCYEIQDTDAFTLAEFPLLYQNLLHNTSMQDACYIGFEKRGNTYIWSNSGSTITYTNWNKNVNFAEDYKYGAISQDGWVLIKSRNELACNLYETDIEVKRSVVNLTYNGQTKMFRVDITNPRNVVSTNNIDLPIFCFTDVSKDKFIEKVNFTASNMNGEGNLSFYFKPLTDDPGNYWCEAFFYPEAKAVKSNVVLLSGDTEEYVVILSTAFPKGTNPLAATNIQNSYRQLKEEMENSQVAPSFYPRIYKIVQIDEKKSTIRFNFHLSSNSKSLINNYSALRIFTQSGLHHFIFVNFLIVNVCIGIQTRIQPSGQTVTWPNTNLGDTAEKPREGWCVNSYGAIMNRYCLGNFIDGAYWSELEEQCVFQSGTNVTVNLTNIVRQNKADRYVDQVVEIVSDDAELSPLDMKLVSNFLGQIAEATEKNIKAVVAIVNELMNEPAHILWESQRFYNTTDAILATVQNLAASSNLVGEIVTENVLLFSYNIKLDNFSAIVLEKHTGQFSLQKYNNVTNAEDIPFDIYFDSAIVFNKNLLQEISKSTTDDETRIILVIYTNPSLFNENYFFRKKTSTIFGVFMPEFNNKSFSWPIAIAYGNNSEADNFECSSWYFEPGVSRGLWQRQFARNEAISRAVCNFYHSSNLAFAEKMHINNITSELKMISSSGFSQRTKLAAVDFLVANYYAYFQPVDILLISEVLNQATQIEEDELELMANIVDGVIEVDAHTLKEAGLKFGATDQIILCFNRILQEFEGSKKIRRNNFYVLIHKTNEFAISGLVINNCQNKCHINIINDINITPTENTEITLWLSTDLISQLQASNVSRIIFSVFFNAILFSRNSWDSKIFTRIIGMHIPNFPDDLCGNIQTTHSIEGFATSDHTCGVWHGGKENGNNWEYDTTPKKVSEKFLCQFWKASYFTLLFDLYNITTNFESLVDSNVSVQSILQKANDIIISYYKYFKPIDIFLVAQLLSKTATVDDQFLEISIDIVGNIMNVDRVVLRESQEVYQATDKILYYFGEITEKFNKTKELHKNNILLIISLLKETGITGIEITDCDKMCNVTIFTNMSQKQMSNFNQIDARLEISQPLLDDLLATSNFVPKLIVTVYYTDALFNDNQIQNNISKVFGVQIPQYTRLLPSEIKVNFSSSSMSMENNNCVYWNFQENEKYERVKGAWEYEGRVESQDTSCRFYKLGYFALLQGQAIDFNITNKLVMILNSSVTLSEKLYKVKSISFYYSKFLSIDVLIMTNILLGSVGEDDDALNALAVIGKNILQIPKHILKLSQIEYNALSNILLGLNRIAKYTNGHIFNIEDQFQLVVCSLDISNGVTVDENGIKCNNDSLKSNENFVAKLVLSENLVNQILEKQMNSTTFIGTVFYDNTIFIARENYDTALILGMELLDFNGTLKGGLTVTFMNNTIRSVGHCALWSYTNIGYNYGKWKISDNNGVTIGDALKKCEFTDVGYYSFVAKNSSELFINITNILVNILLSDKPTSEKIIEAENIVFLHKNNFESIHIYYISQILAAANTLSEIDLKLLANIISCLMDVSRKILVESQELYNATDWIEHHVDRIAGSYQGTIEIVTKNFALVIKKNLSGVIIEQSNNIYNVHVVYESMTIEEIEAIEHLDTALILEEALENQLKNSSAKIVIIIYFSDALCNELYNATSKNFGKIIGTLIPQLTELQGYLRFYYKNSVDTAEMCAFWNYTILENRILRSRWEAQIVPERASSFYICESNMYATYNALFETIKNITNNLENILNSSVPVEEKLDSVIMISESEPEQLHPIDIYLIAQILGVVLDSPTTTEIQMTLTSKIVSSLFQVPRSILRDSQLDYSATDSILFYVDEIARRQNNTTDPKKFIQDNFFAIMLDLKGTNISGLIFDNCNNSICNITTLINRTDPSEIASSFNTVDTAVVLSDELLQQVNAESGSVKLVVNVFTNDVLFNEPTKREISTSMICGLLLPGLTQPLNGSIYIMYNKKKTRSYDKNNCSYWYYQVNDTQNLVRGFWKNDVDPVDKDYAVLCKYRHITHFGLLLAASDDIFEEVDKNHILDIITNINSLLSLLGLLGIMITAALFERWRKNTGNQILINFSVSVSIKIVMLYVSAEVFNNDGKLWCYITGAILHYAILSEFCWMFVIAVLQFKRFVEVLGGPPKYILLKACVCGWVFPALPVALIVTTDVNNYYEDTSNLHLCYPSGLGLYLGIWLPLTIIVSINLVIFIFIMYHVFHKRTECTEQANHEILFQWRLALLLFFILGLTWSFGFIAVIMNQIIFYYVFCFSASLQGFVMFLFFIVFNKSTRFLYMQAMKLWLYSRGYKSS